MKLNKNIIIVSSLILLAALSRLIPHAPNFTAVGAIALFGAAYFKDKRLALIVPFVALWLSDIILNNLVYGAYYSGLNAWFGNVFTYLGFIAIALFGMKFLKRITVGTVLGSSLAASGIFFLISNFGVWLSSISLPANIAGLLTAYAAGIPFFWNTLAANVLFSVILFGSYEWVLKPKLNLSPSS